MSQWFGSDGASSDSSRPGYASKMDRAVCRVRFGALYQVLDASCSVS